ncbi:MAG TPA: carboxypeptidase-like regulatory domain-containing protein [Vicinamibacterales bacterium]|nr:carboxypeptidase-like regulatory domain-containing protein [Vicinamibacterales bacterium]
MRDTAIAAVLLAFLAGLGTTAQAQARRGGAPEATGPGATPRSNASIVGHVLTPDSNSPVRAAAVVAMSRNGRRVSTTTDENGAYQLERLTEGEWLVTAWKGGYVTWQFGQRRTYQTPPPIALKRGERFTADIPLTRGGAISGRVYDPSGDALAGLQVRVYRATMEQGTRRLKAVGVPDMTDDTGSYRVYGLPPGDYYVAASLRVAPYDSIVETTYSPTYFPGTGSLSEAQRIKLGLGGEASATFPLLSLRSTRISGVVLNGAGAPADAFLNLVSEGSELGVPTGAGGVTRSDGTFTLADVSPGRYVLKATLRGDGPDESASLPVVVEGDELTGVTLVTGRPATLRGTIVADAGISRRLPGNLRVVAFSERESNTVLDSGNGAKFEIGALSEPFRLMVDELPEGWGVKSLTVGDVDALDRPIELSPGQQATARVVLTNRVTEVSGITTLADPTTARSIVVFPANSEKWGHRSRYVRLVDADADGHFAIVGLPPGEQYLAYATDYLDGGEHLDPEFLSAIRNAAVPFTLDDSEKRTLELTVVER